MINFVKKYLFIILLAIIILCGFYPRAVGIFTNSFAFTYDVGRDMLQVQQIVVTHKIPLIGQTTGLGGLFYGPWWYYILTPAFILSGGNPQGVAFFMVFIGLMTIILGYILGIIMSGRVLGLIIATLIATSGAMIGFSSQIWNPNIAPLFILLLFICFFSQQKSKKKRFFLDVIMGLLLGLIMDSEIVFGVLFITGFILMFFYIVKKNIGLRSISGILLGFLVILSPRIFFELRHQFVMTKSLFIPHASDQQIFDISSFFLVLPDRAATLFNQFRDTLGVSTQFTAVALVLFLFTFFFLHKKIKNMEKQLLISCLIILLTFLIGSAFFARAVWGHYLVGLPLLYILIVSVVILQLFRISKVFAPVLLVVFAIISLHPFEIVSSYSKPLWEGNAAVYRNQVAVIDYVYKQASSRPFNEIAYTPVLRDYTYQYLFSWYGKSRYGYVPDINKQKLFYVIIEPDPGYEGRIKDWLKVRDGDGKVINEQLVKGGIQVQTRIH